MRNDTLKSRLLAMAERDRRVRAELVDSGELFGGYNERMAEVHKQNAESLGRIIDEVGWPGVARVGTDGAEAAWLVLQHAIGSPEFQRRCLPILEEAARRGDVPADRVARLDDRIRVFEGRPQRFGTQFDWDGNGTLSPYPIEDPDRVDDRRASVGLGPLSEQIRAIRQRAAEEGQKQPANFARYVEEREAWERSVGWR